MNTADDIMGMICTEAIEAHCASQQRMVGRASGSETVEEKRRWLVDYRHTTKAPIWWRLIEVDKRQAADDLVKYWTWRGCDVRVTAVVEVVKRTVTVEEPEISSPNEKLND